MNVTEIQNDYNSSNHNIGKKAELLGFKNCGNGKSQNSSVYFPKESGSNYMQASNYCPKINMDSLLQSSSVSRNEEMSSTAVPTHDVATKSTARFMKFPDLNSNDAASTTLRRGKNDGKV